MKISVNYILDTSIKTIISSAVWLRNISLISQKNWIHCWRYADWPSLRGHRQHVLPRYSHLITLVLNGYLRKDNMDVFVTGRNAKLLSKDIATEFAGRGDEVHMYPLSFAEFMTVWKWILYAILVLPDTAFSLLTRCLMKRNILRKSDHSERLMILSGRSLLQKILCSLIMMTMVSWPWTFMISFWIRRFWKNKYYLL